MTRKADPRTARLPVKPGELPDFAPVPRRCARHDGWTPERQRAFIEALADTGSVSAACKAVDMSTVGAYYLRRQPGAQSFREAWQKALDLGVERLEDVAMERGIHGVEEPFYVYGNHVGTRTRYNDRLLMFLLRNRAPERFGNSVTKGGGSLKGLNAVGKMEKRRLKKKWRAQWEAEQRARDEGVSPAEVRASIDRKVEAVRAELEQTRARQWAQMSKETRKAWARFTELRDADFARLKADEAMRTRLERGPEADEQWAKPPTKKAPPPPKPRKTAHSLKDKGWE
ncbi:MAG: hypothetical protein QNI87_05250 [Erythrobacter sp.]|uniref:hypothetical protein n=1 Tax=Erythrobacter sp. TaxID=1042 RepID=UPI0026233A89|nr:hypothetical protein [Erythrobacter sp.]MDJ0977924.1 hypothetical protein [Erythrobacter sp.]